MQDLISTIASQVVKNVNVSQLMSSNLGQGLLTSVISNVGNISLTSMDPTNNLGAGQTTILLAIPVNDIVVSSISPVLGLIDHAQIIIPAISASMGYISSSGSVNTAAASMQAQRAQITVWLGAAASAVQTSMVQLNLTMTDTTAATQLSSSLMGILFGSQLATVTLRSTAASEFVFNFALQGTTVVATSNVLSLDLSALGKAQENGLVTFVSAFANVSSNGQTFVQPCNFLPGVLCPTSVSYTPYTYATNPAITNVLLPLKLRLNSGPVAFPASLQFPNIYINLSATPLVFDTSIFDLGPVLYVGASAVAISTTIDPISGQFLLNIVMDANLKFRQDGISNLISSFNLNSVVVQAIENGVNLSTISVNLVGSQKVNILSSMASSLTARAIVNSTEFLNNFRYLVIDATVPRSAAGELLVNLAVTTTEGTALPNLMFGMFALQVSSQGSAFLQTTSPNLNISSGLIDVQFDLTFSNPTTINTFIKSLLLSAKSGNTAPMEVSLSGPVGFYLPMEISVNGAFNWLFGIITRSNLFADILYNSDTNAANPTSIGAAVDGLFSSAFAYGCPASHLRIILLEVSVSHIWSTSLTNKVTGSSVQIGLVDIDGVPFSILAPFNTPLAAVDEFNLFSITQTAPVYLSGQVNEVQWLDFNGQSLLGSGTLVEGVIRIWNEVVTHNRLCMTFDVATTVTVASPTNQQEEFQTSLNFDVFQFLKFFADVFLPPWITNYLNNCPV
eukprot:TRINITY_DN4485_c0_g1_i2.p1 TRINITY_DN4485_c0_g1~~TRINITY_DN4485_c0_g1_i2.p1  ORF type:complete len:843 (-),score=203.64 TRINITY_DN4485_c0_g1_i2:218-2419(-)